MSDYNVKVEAVMSYVDTYTDPKQMSQAQAIEFMELVIEECQIRIDAIKADLAEVSSPPSTSTNGSVQQ